MTDQKSRKPTIADKRKVALSRKLERRLQSYVADATGIAASWDKVTLAAGFLAFAAMPSSAEVVYTPTDQELVGIYRHSLRLDVNNDGQPDFNLWIELYFNASSGVQQVYSFAGASGRASNRVISSVNEQYEAALPLGEPIGPAQRFQGSARLMAYCEDFSGHTFKAGPWVNVQNRYLGLKFQIDGETHYGWARMSVGCAEITLTGYAFETVADQPIAAGVLPFANDGDLQSVPSSGKPASLAVLAAGASARPLWRK